MNALLKLDAAPLTMSSLEIAELVESRHDTVKLSMERLAARGVIQLPPLTEVNNHQGQSVSVYQLGKRDSYVAVAQLSPEFTARLVDRWQELDALVRGLQAQGVFPGLRALSVTMTGQPDWVGQGVAAVLDDGHPQ